METEVLSPGFLRFWDNHWKNLKDKDFKKITKNDDLVTMVFCWWDYLQESNLATEQTEVSHG